MIELRFERLRPSIFAVTGGTVFGVKLSRRPRTYCRSGAQAGWSAISRQHEQTGIDY